MKYVDWVETVLRAIVETFDTGDGFATSIQAIHQQLGVELDDRAEPMWEAIRDLEGMGLVEQDSGWFVETDHEARKIRVTSLRSSWPRIHDTWLEERQERFLAKLCELSERRSERWAHLEEVQGDVVLEAMGEQPERGDAFSLIQGLAEVGLVDGTRMTLGSFPTFPTYAGLVRATEKLTTEGQTLVSDLLEDWETTNTDFKRELHLGTKDEKAEFVRDALALANTQVTGKRYLVSGFDPKSHAFTTTADPAVTQDRIEDVLNEYTVPPVTARYVTFPWIDDAGDVGLLEVIRDRRRVPYRVRRSLSGQSKSIAEGQVFLRHGSHVTEASRQEIGDLEAEARRALATG